MGTSYYFEEKEPCKECGRHYEQKCIGKSSAGWCFALHIYPDDGIVSLTDWEKIWAGKRIVNQYGNIISSEKMLEIITIREWPAKPRETCPPINHRSWEKFHEENGLEDGPNGLLRHRIGKGHCIGHGNGTWDLVLGDFS